MTAASDVETGDSFEPELRFVLAFAAEASELVRELRLERHRGNSTKSDGSFVTWVDRFVNSEFVSEVRFAFPLDRVLGEEQSLDAAGPRTWAIDPIDGTEQFMLGVPTFMIAIALTDAAGQPVVACLVNPSTRELYHAVRGRGAFRDGEPLHVSKRDAVSEPAIVRASGAARRNSRGLETEGVVRMQLPGLRLSPVRYPWPSAFSGCKVAEGVWDADLYSHTGAHDVAATALLVTEAGGRATDRHGHEQRYDRPVNGCILSNGVVHETLVRQWRPDPG